MYYREADDSDTKTQSAIDELIDTKWSGSNESKMKAVELIKGLVLADNEKANKFIKKLDDFTSGLKSKKAESRKNLLDRKSSNYYISNISKFGESKMNESLWKFPFKPNDKRTALVVLDNSVLGYVFPEFPANINILHSRQSHRRDGETTHTVYDNNVRLATPEDFEHFRVLFTKTGYGNRSEYIYSGDPSYINSKYLS